MIKLKNFKIDKDLDSNKTYLNLKNYIDLYVEQSFYEKNIFKISKILNLPENVIKLKIKRLIYNKFDPTKGKFKLGNNPITIFSSYLFFLIFFVFVKLFGKKKATQKKYDIILDEIDNIRQFDKFDKILKKFKKPIIFTKSKLVQDNGANKKVKVLRYNNFFFNYNLLEKNTIDILKFFSLLCVNSCINKENYLIFFIKIFFSFMKNQSLFSKVKADIILQDRFYINCPIKNYIFKQNGGKKIICCQYHLAESGICFYSDIDILFSFGKEMNTEKKLKIFGSRINNSMPIGSLEMEREFYHEKSLPDEEKNCDLLVIGINPSHWIKISNKIFEGYYDYLKWIRKFSDLNPEIKVLYKHHSSFKGDVIEESIFQTSKLEIIRAGNTYQFLKNCKVAVSYGSTMILEGISLKKDCYFVDPGNHASTFYSYHNFNQDLILNSYNDFSEKILTSLKSQKSRTFDYDRMCLDSSTTSERIYTNITNLKIENKTV